MPCFFLLEPSEYLNLGFPRSPQLRFWTFRGDFGFLKRLDILKGLHLDVSEFVNTVRTFNVRFGGMNEKGKVVALMVICLCQADKGSVVLGNFMST